MHDQMDGDADRHIDRLISTLSSPDRLARAEAARQLCNMGKRSIRAFPALMELFRDPSSLVRIQVPRAIIHIGAYHDRAVADILDNLLKDEDEVVRLYAEEAYKLLFVKS